MTISINYQKRKNHELFKSLEDSKTLFLSKTQNYIPIYKRFFSLNETNYNNINLNHKWYISSIGKHIEDTNNIFFCNIKNIVTQKSKSKAVFFKMAPLLDPYKYLIGKYNVNDETLFNLPTTESTDTNCNSKFLDVNNCAYVDGFFLFLSSNLIYNNNFIHGLDYYGSFLAIKNNYKLNIFDDLEYLVNSSFFNKNKDKLFKVDDYGYLFSQYETNKLGPIKIERNLSNKSGISIMSLNNELFENIFEDDKNNNNDNNNNDNNNNDNNNNDDSHINLNDLKNMTLDLIDITNSNPFGENDKTTTLKSGSSCSSRTSHTSTENSVNNENNENGNCCNCGETIKRNNSCDNCHGLEEIDNEESSDEDDDEEEEGDDEEEQIYATIPKFPIQLICMENCEDTFDNLILNNDLTPEEWYSAFMQIIMILITYQKAFAFTHNDLHTNNVMYNSTNKKYIHYCYKKKYYKVPTFGRIFKIIDFGRSIYKFNGNIFCSDSFKNGNDASTQYNTEPYLNEKKPRLEPNFSFDICRLACSIFDYLIEDIEEIKDITTCDPVKRLIVEWCLDDNGINMLYKNNGADRYPDFKLYKMIARCVHNHTPQAQLNRPEFNAYSDVVMKDINLNELINIDNIPSYV
jgi:hypothetical protein